MWGDGTDDREPELLVRVDALWTRWAPLTKEPAGKQPWEEHDRLLTRLLGDDGKGPGAIRHAPEKEDMEVAWDKATQAEQQLIKSKILMPYPAKAQWSTPSSVSAEQQQVVDGLRSCCDAITRAEKVRDAPLEATINLYAHRVHLFGEQLWRLVESRQASEDAESSRPRHGDDPSDLQACIDFRVRSHLGHFWLYATLSLWSSRPHCIEHAPRVERDSEPQCRPGRRPRDLRSLCGEMERWRNAFKDLLLTYYLTVEPAVLRENDTASFRRKYRPPRFWIVRCRHQPHAQGESCLLIDTLCRTAFGAPADASDVVTEVLEHSGDVGRGRSVPLEVRRRLQHVTEGAVPAYVIAPARTEGSTDEKRQEEAVRKLVQSLTLLETKIAADLLDTTTDLDIEGRFAEVYGAVVGRASELWDQLAMRLPMARGAELGELHQLIELVHLTLLQGLADLGYSKAKVAELLARLEGPDEGEIDLSDTFVGPGDRRRGGSLAESLRTGGYIGRTRSWAGQVAARSTFVLEHYTSLLDAISKAFDERRVRDTDRIGAVGLGLASALGLIGFGTETYGKLLGDEVWWPIGFFVLWIVVIAVVARAMWHRVARLGSLSSTDYLRTAYPPVSAYLQLCRTERIARLDEREEGLRRKQQASDGSDALESWRHYHARWHELDLDLARRYADVLDFLATVSLSDPTGSTFDGLRRDVEQWTVFALLLSERPRTFYSRPLPCLALMYRFLPPPPDTVGLLDSAGEAPVAVSDADLLLTLRVQCGAELKHVPTVIAWGDHLQRRAVDEGLSARAVLDLIERSGLRSGMSYDAWQLTFDHFCRDVGDLRKHPLPPGFLLSEQATGDLERLGGRASAPSATRAGRP